MTDTAYRENELLNRLAAGEQDAFTTVYNHYYQRIYFYAQHFLNDKEDAEDITADTFVKLWNRRDSFVTMSAINAFLHITTRNSCFDLLRHRKVKTEKQAELVREIELHEFSTLHETREELLKLVQKEVEKMSGRLQEIYHLSYNEGLSPSEIAKNLHVSVQTVSNQKTSVIKTLKRVLVHHISISLIMILMDSGRSLLR